MALLHSVSILLFLYSCAIFAEADGSKVVIPEHVAKKLQSVVKNRESSLYKQIENTRYQNSDLVLTNQNIMTSSFKKFVFNKDVDFLLSHFNNDVSFQFSIFKNKASFSSTEFLKKANFDKIVFLGNTNFQYSQFKGAAQFNNSVFQGSSSFYNVTFQNTSRFISTKFKNNIDFGRAAFYLDNSFRGATFSADSNFKETAFYDKADFSSAKFKGNTNFDHAFFYKELNFSGAEFHGDLSFEQCVLPDNIDLSNITIIKDQLDLTNCVRMHHFNRVNINLLGSNLMKIKLYYRKFKLYFPPDTLSSNIKETYQQLFNSLKKNNFEQDYAQAVKEYAEYEYLRNNRWITNLIDKYWWDYGFERSRIYLWILILLIGFTIINNFFYDWLQNNAFEIGFLPHNTRDPLLQRNPVLKYIYNFPFSFIYTLYLFFGSIAGFKRDTESFKSKKVFINLYLMLIIGIGVVCTLFVLNSLLRGSL